MQTNHQITVSPNFQPTFAQRLRHSKALISTMAVMAVTVLALAATLVVNHSQAQSGGNAVVTAPVATAVQGPAATTGAHAGAAPNQARHPSTVMAQAARGPVCGHCGTVESVTPVERSVPTSGVGAVAGGVVGGLLGNQVGGGTGRAAMTVLGAVGGGFAGNAIEKHVKKKTIYRMRIRMNNGTIRTVEQAAPMGVGAPVVIEGHTAKPARVATSAARTIIQSRFLA